MTDHRATALSYGHLGEASYDIDNQSWYFSSDTSLDSSIQPLQPVQEYISPSLRPLPKSNKLPSIARQSQDRWLRKVLPEAGPAKAIVTFVAKAPDYVSPAQQPSTLLAIGRASDIDKVTGARSTQLMAIVCGEAGNQLRLIKPLVEALKWDSRDDTKLRSISPVAGEDCYWSAEGGGAIQQIIFGADTNGVTSWLAVRLPDSITILRPLYHRVQMPSLMPFHAGEIYPPSRLNPNPILKLRNERSGGWPHADVSFNPWYIRQFAVINLQGYWSVWDVEGQRRKRTTFEAKPSKFGRIQDDISQGESLKSHDNADGWGRILWVGGVNTLVVCNRRDLAVFDLKATPKRLNSPKLVQPNSADWILDVKRSSANLNNIFILTTRQVFWLHVAEESEDQLEQYGYAGARILLSCQHFRNHEDEKAKLEVLGENEGCTVLLFSPQSPLVNTYRFSMTLGELTIPMCSQGSFIIGQNDGDLVWKPFSTLQNLCLLPTTFMLHNLKPMSGPAMQYLDHNIRFYQLFGLSETLGLYHALCATRWTTRGKSDSEPVKYHSVLPPTIKDTRIGKIKSSPRVVEHQFIVPDGLEEEEDNDIFSSFSNISHVLSKHNSFHRRHGNVHNGSILSVDARRLFIVSFYEKHLEGQTVSTSNEMRQSIVEYSKAVKFALEERKSTRFQGLITLLDLVKYTSFSEDIDEAASALKDLMEALSSTAEDPGIMSVTSLAIKPSSLMDLVADTTLMENIPSLSRIYDKLVELWISCLPESTPGLARLAKEKLVRNIAIELCLSSMGVLVRDQTALLPGPKESQEETDFVLPVRTKPNSSGTSIAKFLETSKAIPVSSLPTPTATPSLHSNDGTNSLSEPTEDEAISRLRGYTASIKSQPPLGASRSAILTHWPSTPGIDPSKYSWDTSRKSFVENEEIQVDEEALVRQRERDRRRRRTEKFLKRQNINTIETASQPAPARASGSQPDPAEHSIPSQGTHVPMTQPDRGAFGSRLGPKGFKKRRTMGF